MIFPRKKHSSDFWNLVKQCSLLCHILTQDPDEIPGSLGDLNCVNGYVKEGFVVIEFHDFVIVAFREENASQRVEFAPFNQEAVVRYRHDCWRVVGNLNTKTSKPVYFTGHGSAGLSAIYAADRDWVEGVLTFGLPETECRELEIPVPFPLDSIISIQLDEDPVVKGFWWDAFTSRIVLPNGPTGSREGIARFSQPINKAILTKWTPGGAKLPLPPLDDILTELEGGETRRLDPEGRTEPPSGPQLQSPLKVVVLCHPKDKASTREYIESLRLLFDGFSEETDGYLSGFSGLLGVLRVISRPPCPADGESIRKYFDDTLHTLAVVLMDQNLGDDEEYMGWLDEAAKVLGRQAEPTAHQLFPLGVNDLSFAKTDRYHAFSRIHHVSARELGHAEVSSSHAALLTVAQAYHLLGNALPERKKLTLFLSHAKKDGLPLAKSITAQIDQLPGNLEQHRFFDTESLEPGKPWDEQLRDRAGCCVMLVLRTRLYETRAWCREEFLTAVKNDVPIVVVEARSDDNATAASHSGHFGAKREVNLPFGRYPVTHVRDGNLIRVVGLALTEGLRQLIFERDAYQVGKAGLVDSEITRRFNVHSGIEGLMEICLELAKANYPWQNCCILYREPDISAVLENGYERIIRSFFPFGKLRTCSRLQDEGLNTTMEKYIAGKVAGISISEVEGLLSGNEANQLTLQAVERLFSHGASVAFGHDWREGGIMEAVYDRMKRSLLPGSQTKEFRILNLTPWKHGSQNLRGEELKKPLQQLKVVVTGLPTQLSDDFVTAHPELRYAFNAMALSEMRSKLTDLCDFRLCIGGKIGHSSGTMAGILEEAALAIQNRQPLYLCGHWGGATQAVCDMILKKGNQKPEDFRPKGEVFSQLVKLRGQLTLPVWGPEAAFQVVADLSIEELSHWNGLGAGENRELFELSDIRQILGLVLKGLTRIYTGRH